MKISKIAVVVIALAFSVSFASAQELNTGVSPTSDSVRKEIQNVKEEINSLKAGAAEAAKKARGDIQQNAQAARENLKTESERLRAELQTNLQTIKANTSLTPLEIKETAEKAREAARATLQEKAEAVKAVVLSDREEFKDQIKIRREEIKQKAEAENTELKNRLQSMKDERKKQVVTGVAEQLQKANANYLDKLTVTLGNIEEVLRGVSARADKAALEGRDVSIVRADIVDAESAIATAKSYITAQSGTTYTIQVTTEDNLKADTSSAREALKGDLDTVKDAVKKAHEAVRKAASDLGKVPQVNQEFSE